MAYSSFENLLLLFTFFFAETFGVLPLDCATTSLSQFCQDVAAAVRDEIALSAVADAPRLVVYIMVGSATAAARIQRHVIKAVASASPEGQDRDVLVHGLCMAELAWAGLLSLKALAFGLYR